MQTHQSPQLESIPTYVFFSPTVSKKFFHPPNNAKFHKAHAPFNGIISQMKRFQFFHMRSYSEYLLKNIETYI